MTNKTLSVGRVLCALIVCLTILTSAAGQQGQQPPQDEVLRIRTELVQTGVMVFDKQGRFVEGLKPEQFELRVDGNVVTPSFFERVIAGTAREEKLVEAAARPAAGATASAPAPPPVYRGRTIVFFIDDLHLSLDSLNRTRSALTYFIEKEMTPTDQVAFVSASGQIGFLQQFTDNRAVLRTALARVNPIPNTVRDTDQPPMTEFIAIRIQNGDRQAADYYIDKILESYTTKRLTARQINRQAVYETVKNRANYIISGIESVTAGTLISLNNLLRTTNQMAGRKLIFFVSDGFYLDTRKGPSAANTQLQRVIDNATRTGSVIYTIDARGLFAPMPDATNDRPFDPMARLDRSNVGEGILSQDGLSALAADTGGRFLKNQNYFDTWVTRMLGETSNYYLLAWRPASEEQKSPKFKRIEVSIVGRPDLTVRLPRGFLTGAPEADADSNAAKSPPASESKGTTPAPAKGQDAELMRALATTKKGLPTKLALSFVDVPGTGPVLTTSVQMATDVLGYGADGKKPAAIDVAGVILTDQGKQAGGFKTRVNVSPLADSGNTEDPSVIYSHKVPLKPGLYQVRVAARDDGSGKVGSAYRWIEVPDLTAGRLTLSSLMVGRQFIGSAQARSGGDGGQMQFSVDRRFKRGSHLNFLTLVYNAARGAGGTGAPALEAQIRILRDGQAIVTSPPRQLRLDPGADPARVPYGADIALQNLPAGLYTLEVIINDRVANKSTSQQVTFEVEN